MHPHLHPQICAPAKARHELLSLLGGRTLSKRAFTLPVKPDGKDRLITIGFSLLQRIGKAAQIRIWYPERADIEAAARADKIAAPAIEWAALHEVELFAESGNIKIQDLDVMNLNRAFIDLDKMRADGYRLVVATAGIYAPSRASARDEYRIFDNRMKEKLQNLVEVMWLDDLGEICSEQHTAALRTENWNHLAALPHVGTLLAAHHLFRRGREDRRALIAQRLFEAIDALPAQHRLSHDVTMGLKLPQYSATNQWIYIAPGDMTASAFNRFLTDIFAPLDAGKATVQHLRGYGDRMRRGADAHYRKLAGINAPQMTAA